MALSSTSLMQRLVAKHGARAIYEQLTPTERRELSHRWRAWARPEQMMPGTAGAKLDTKDWRYWVLLAGRGFGKTRTGAESVREQVESGARGAIAFVAPTFDDARALMVEGPSGILEVSPDHWRPKWNQNEHTLTWPNGAEAYVYTSVEPDRIRGREHDMAWGEELGFWKYPDDTWRNLQLTMRKVVKSGRPFYQVTTTPKPIPLLKRLIYCHEVDRHTKPPAQICPRCHHPFGTKQENPRTAITRGSTYDNRLNLDAAFFEELMEEFEGTRLGRQELWAEILDDVEGALWTRALLELCRMKIIPPMRRIVVAVDPAVTSTSKSAETGIVVVGIAPCFCQRRVEDHAFVLEDCSGRFSPSEWGRKVVDAVLRWDADTVVGEINNGGDLVERNVRAVSGDPGIDKGVREKARSLRYKSVRASRGKVVRAEPVAGLYEQLKVHHVGVFPGLEEQQCEWVPSEAEESPDRVDALTWGVTETMLGTRTPRDDNQAGGYGKRRFADSDGADDWDDDD